MSQNEQLHTTCKAWLEAAIHLLKDKPLSIASDIDVTFTPDGGWSTQNIEREDFVQLVQGNRVELSKLSEIDTIVQLVASSPTISSALLVDAAGNPIQAASQRTWVESFVLSKFLFVYLSKTNAVTFVPSTFESIYNQLEEYIYRTEFTGVWLANIRNLTLDVEHIRLDRTTSLRRATDEEKANVVKSNMPFNRPFFGTLPTAFLEVQQPIDRHAHPDPSTINEQLQPVILALRLLKPNPLGIVSLQWSTPDQPFRILSGFLTTLPLHPFAFMGESYVLTQEESSMLPQLWRRTRKAYRNAKLSVALTRFEDAYTRTKNEDKLIDYWTALEALFLADESSSYQMSKTLGLALAYYIGENETKRNSIKNDLSRSHDLRNDAVHGKPISQRSNLAEMVTKTENHLRQVLKKRIEET